MTSSDDIQNLRVSVSDFLTQFLVERNPAKALTSFSQSAFENLAMFDDSCSGYVKDGERTAGGIRRGVEKFLNDAGSLPLTQSLRSLSAEALVPLKRKMGARAVNFSTDDPFILVHATPGEVASLMSRKSAKAFLRKHLRSKSPVVSYIPLGQGVGYLVWVKEGAQWKIWHASLVCM